MHTRRIRIALFGLIGFTLATAGLAAQKGKPKPPALPDIPGQAVFNCAGPATSSTFDRVCGDGDGFYVDESLNAGDMDVLVSLRSGDNQFRLRFDPTGAPSRALTVFIPERLPAESFECSGNCLVGNNGDPIGNTAITVEVHDGEADDARIQTTMKDQNGNTISGGPTTLDIGESAPIDVLIGFQDPNGNGYRWGLYWSPQNYPGSTPATITRTGLCTWDIEAGSGDIVGLRLFNTGLNGKNKHPYEGRFDMPFKITFTADDLPGGCS